VISFAEFAAEHPDVLDHLDEYSDAALDRIALGHELTAPQYLHALRMRSVVQAELDAAFKRCDVLLSPGTPTTAPVLFPQPHPMFSEGHGMWLDWVARTLLTFNVAGAPAVVVPSGFDPAGLPTSIQIGARPQHDEVALEVAAAYQAITDHHLRQPPVPVYDE